MAHTNLEKAERKIEAKDEENLLHRPTYRQKESRTRKKKLIQYGVVAVVLLVVVIAIIIYFLQPVTTDSGSSFPSKKHVSNSLLGVYRKGAVTTNGKECAQIGSDILAKNGSAVDAAIAALLCEGIACMHSMGLGGGFLMTIWDAKTQTADYIDARETAPLAATKDMYHGNRSLSMRGGLAVAVPGELLGYWEAHQKYGKLKWAELFEPAIGVCETGSLVTNYQASYATRLEKYIKAEETMAEFLISPETNSTWKAGDRIKRPKLAKTLKIIAENGPDIFYNGTMGDQLISELKAFGGIMTKEDLQSYTVKWRTPIKAKIGNLTMFTAPPPAGGVILTFIMNVLQNLLPTSDEGTMWQRIVETFKWAYARRTELGDPDFVDIANLVENLTSTEYAEYTSGRIRDDWTSADPAYYGAVTAGTRESGTAHISVLAPDGSAVSVTSTINQVFGAMIRSNSTGIIFNDEMDDFSSPNITNGFGIPASPANYIAPGKRPLSSMNPTIILDENGDVRLVIGAAGGTKITTGVAIALILNLWSGYDIKEALDARRLHHQLFPMKVENEEGFSESALEHLNKIGHKSAPYGGVGSAITAISKIKGNITANADYRREGSVAGF